MYMYMYMYMYINVCTCTSIFCVPIKGGCETRDVCMLKLKYGHVRYGDLDLKSCCQDVPLCARFNFGHCWLVGSPSSHTVESSAAHPLFSSL